MYTIYISNYKDASGNEVSSENRLYGIPISHQESESFYPFLDPIIKTEMGKTGTFEFGMNPAHPYYDSLLQMKTVIRVEYDGDTIFRGRVLTIDNTPLKGERKIHLEGDLAFLMDSQQPGIKEVDRTVRSIYGYLQFVISNHNAQMNEGGNSYKNMTLGEVPGHYSSSINELQKVKTEGNKAYGSDSWQTTMDALGSLSKEYGGYFRTRYVNGVCYLDWLEYCFQYSPNSQAIEIGENLIDINGSSEVDNIFTALIPIGSKKSEPIYIEGYKEEVHGHNKRILVPDIVSQFTDSELNSRYHSKNDYLNAVNQYGIIYKTQSFQNADTQEKLWSYAINWIRDNYVGGITSFDITALDLHHIDGQIPKYIVGDRVTVIYPDKSPQQDFNSSNVTKTLTVTSIQYNLYSPQNNSYSIGIPNSILSKSYGSKSTGKSGSVSGGGGKKKGDDDDAERQKQIILEQLQYEAANHIISVYNNNDEYKRLQELDPNNPARYASVIKSSELRLANNMYYTEIEEDGSLKQQLVSGVTSFLLDAGTQSLKFMDPVVKKISEIDPDGVPYDRYVDATTSTSLELDGYNRYIGIKGVPDWRQLAQKYILDPGEALINPIGYLLKMHGTESPDSSSQSANLELSNFNVSDPEAIVEQLTTSMKGDNGSVNSMLSTVGKDGTGDLSTIVSDGVQAVQKMLDPSTVGTTGTNPVETINFLGGADPDYSGTGTPPKGLVQVGKTGSAWNVLINKKISYTGFDGQTHETDGFTVSKDYKFSDYIDSLRTELLAVDVLLADYAQIGTLEAMKANIEDLSAKAITTTNLSAAIADVRNVQINYTLTVGSHIASWKNQLVVTSVTQDEDDLTIDVGRVRIYYLGYDPNDS